MIGRDFLPIAHLLLVRPEEASWRSAVSRAYYAAFHGARELLTALRFQVPRADRAHGYLWLRLQNCGNPHLEQIGRDLQELRRLRNEADYDLSRPFVRSFARSQLQTAEAIILALEGAALEPVRSQITNAMRTYETVIGQVTWWP